MSVVRDGTEDISDEKSDFISEADRASRDLREQGLHVRSAAPPLQDAEVEVAGARRRPGTTGSLADPVQDEVTVLKLDPQPCRAVQLDAWDKKKREFRPSRRYFCKALMETSVWMKLSL